MPLHPDFERVYTLAALPINSCRLILQRGGEVAVARSAERTTLPAHSDVAHLLEFALEPVLPLGKMGEAAYAAVSLPEGVELPSEYEFVDIRQLFGALPLEEYLIAGYAGQIRHWTLISAHCGSCGGTMSGVNKEWMRKCSGCGNEVYPPVCPALLVLVHDGGDGLLMAHKPGWGDRYSIFAGFVLPGESLEECVHREVLEEAGVIVNDLQYAGSQPWPFPHQLMIGFRARYVSGEIAIDEEELDDSRWFTATTLPALPGPLSLSRQMIDSWVNEVMGAI